VLLGHEAMAAGCKPGEHHTKSVWDFDVNPIQRSHYVPWADKLLNEIHPRSRHHQQNEEENDTCTE
jgi:hypothetical protein